MLPSPASTPAYLADKANAFIDSILSLASSKSPVNLSPLQIGFDVANRAKGVCEDYLVSPTLTVAQKTRDAVLSLFK
jgi:hypothetical protein